MNGPHPRSLDTRLKDLKSSEDDDPGRYERYEFGPYALEPGPRLLLRDGAPVALTPKAFETLVLFVKNQGRVLEREWLVERLWPHTFVEPNNLDQCVSALRRAFGETAQTASYIRTVAGRGYCLSAHVSEVRSEPVDAGPRPVSAAVELPAAAVSRRLSMPWVVGLMAVLLVVALARVGRRPATTNGHAPRVLPVTSFPGLEDFPSISPDGNFVAFTWTGPQIEGAATDIFIKPVDSDGLTQLTSTPASESSPAWSPDGREIAFSRFGPGRGVYIASVLGGRERKVADSGAQVGWSHDGRSLLMRDWGTRERSFGIFRIDLVRAGGARSRRRRAGSATIPSTRLLTDCRWPSSDSKGPGLPTSTSSGSSTERCSAARTGIVRSAGWSGRLTAKNSSTPSPRLRVWDNPCTGLRRSVSTRSVVNARSTSTRPIRRSPARGRGSLHGWLSTPGEMTSVFVWPTCVPRTSTA